MAVALIVAAGRGERLGSDRPKTLVHVGGRPMLEWSVEVLGAVCDQVVVALPPGVVAPAGTLGVVGGAERSLSVRSALRAASGDPVLVHDAARPLVTVELAQACLDALDARDLDAAVAAAAVTDTIKEAGADQVVSRTLDRSRLWAIQTPQAFRREALERALAQPDDVVATATDDAALVEALGGRVGIVEAPRENLKVTTRLDLQVAELLLRKRGQSPDSHGAKKGTDP
ncbi:MAG: 2-C-methyl-D-erythritol 4-phosphate cytidylyltransferase [Actinobacteria bacterium]|nr:MAG: 2-C-methyl-D-erythritol 4-phosphate cytidylyltransferase [Actinomycetota bacterium]